MANKPKYQLDDLLAKCDSSSSIDSELSDEYMAWINAKPVGKEFGAASGVLRGIETDYSVSDEQSLQSNFE